MTDTRSVLTGCALRCTRQRVEVYQALAATKLHPTAEELHRMVETRSPGTSLATVYNTLEALCGAGLARRIATTQGATRYDADTSPHVHAVRGDGTVLDLPEELAAEMMNALPRGFAERVAKRIGGEITHVSLQFTPSQA